MPTLIVGDKALTETGALLEYIAALVPEKKLVPTDPLQAFKMRSVMFYLASTMHVNHAHKMRGSRWADQQTSCDDMTSKVPQTMGTSASYIEDECLQGPFILGDTFCVADIYLFNVCTCFQAMALRSKITRNSPRIWQPWKPVRLSRKSVNSAS